MRKIPPSSLIAAVAATAWSVFAAFWLYPYREPLVGFGPGGYVQATSFRLGLGVGVILLVHYRKRLLAGVVVLVALVFALPLPSKAGVLFRIENLTGTPAQIIILRTDDPKRRVLLTVPASGRISYRTAPGDYSEAVEFSLESGTWRLTTSVIELRRRVVLLSETNLFLVEPQKK